MSQLSFKNVGVKGFKQEEVLNKNRTQLPIGIKTPVQLSPDGQGLFAMHTDIKEQIADNLRNLILTNWGERLGNYFFGSNLRPLLADFSHKDDFDNEAMIRINTAITKYMPFITPMAYESKTYRPVDSPIAKAEIILIYSVEALGITNAALKVNLFGI